MGDLIQAVVTKLHAIELPEDILLILESYHRSLEIELQELKSACLIFWC